MNRNLITVCSCCFPFHLLAAPLGNLLHFAFGSGTYLYFVWHFRAREKGNHSLVIHHLAVFPLMFDRLAVKKQQERSYRGIQILPIKYKRIIKKSTESK